MKMLNNSCLIPDIKMNYYSIMLLIVVSLIGCRNQPNQESNDNKTSDLKVELKVPRKRYFGYNFIYCEIILKNNGDKTAETINVTMPILKDVKVVSVDDGGKQLDKRIIWQIPKILSKKNVRLHTRLTAKAPMKLKTRIIVTEKNKAPQEVTGETEIALEPNILLSLKDTNDPVKVGEEEVYIITIMNPYTFTATNIRLECILDDNMEFIDSVGPTKGKKVGNKIFFKPLPKMTCRDDPKWKVFVGAFKAKSEARFIVKLFYDQWIGSVKVSEATNFIE